MRRKKVLFLLITLCICTLLTACGGPNDVTRPRIIDVNLSDNDSLIYLCIPSNDPLFVSSMTPEEIIDCLSQSRGARIGVVSGTPAEKFVQDRILPLHEDIHIECIPYQTAEQAAADLLPGDIDYIVLSDEDTLKFEK